MVRLGLSILFDSRLYRPYRAFVWISMQYTGFRYTAPCAATCRGIAPGIFSRHL